MRYEDASGAFQASGPIANDDADTLSAGQRGPATGNLITGEGTQYGAAGADSSAGAQVTTIAGKGGEDTSFSGGKLSVDGEHGRLTVDAEGNYSYLANGNVENVRDRFTYTLADNQGNSDTAALIIEIGKTPAVIKADAQQIVPGPDGVVTLPPGVELSDVRVVGRNLVVDLPDGTQLIIIDGAIFVPQLVLGGVEVPATNVAALLIGQEVQPAAGEIPPSGGGNFALPPPPLDPGIPLGDLIPPTEYGYTPPDVEEIGQIIDREPEIFIQPDDQPAAVNAVDSVDEKGLPTRTGDEPEGSGEEAAAGADGDTSEATTGTIIINSPDGVASVTINNVLVTGVIGQEIEGDFGTLTITGFDGDNILYSYVLDDNTSGNDTQDDFEVVLTDDDGDTATATLTIDIIDDVPTARPDTDAIAAGEYGPVTGNVITDASAGDADDSDSGRDTVGADDADLTAVTGFGSTTPAEGGWTVNGQYGVLTIATDGSYSYTRNPGTPGGVQDVFNYTLTDGDGDTSSTTLTITIGDSTPETRPNPTALLDDDALANGNPGGVGDDPDSANLSGNLTGVGGDGPLTFNVLLTGAPAGFTYVSGGDGIVLVQQGGQTVLTVTVDSETGAYTVVQNAPIDHPAGSDENNVSFTINYTVTDQDGDSAPGTIDINVDDDTPEVTEGQVGGTVDEDGVPGGIAGGPDDVAGAVTVVNGSVASLFASGADTPLSYSLLSDTSGLPALTSGGVAVTYSVVGNVLTASAGGATVFTFALNADGSYTFTLVDQLDHPSLDGLPGDDTENDLELALGSIVQATDADGDSVTAADDGVLIVVDDDTPTAQDIEVSQASEDANVVINIVGSIAGGADGVDLADVTFSAHNGSGNLSYNDNGVFTYEPAPGEEGDVTFTYTIVDGDGDEVTKEVTIHLAPDSEPEIGTPENLIVDEDGLAGANVDNNPLQANPGETDSTESATDSGSVVVDFGNDVPDAPLADSIELLDSGALDGQLVDLDGNPVTFALNGSGQLVGTANGTTVMVISITGAVAGPGAGEVTYSYQAQLFEPIEHADSGNNENTDLLSGIQFRVTDSDGDQSTGSFNVTVVDDVPSATNDVDNIAAGGDTAQGNVITGVGTNAGAANADTVGVDTPGTITAISGFGGSDSTFSGGILEVDGQYGSLDIAADGSYTYTRFDGAPGDVQDVFTYTLTDADGDEVTATLTINIGDAAPNLPDPPLIRLDDDVIPGANGNPEGVGDDDPDAPDDNVVEGSLAGTGGDGTLTYNFTGVNTLPAGFTIGAGSDADTLLINQGGTLVMTIQLNQATGDFTVTQNAPIDHLAGDNENNFDFSIGVEVEDADGDVEPAAITINVDDDTPVLTNVQAGDDVTLDETAAGTPAGFPINATSDTAVITATQAFGADGAAAVNSVVYGLAIVGGSPEPSGLATAIGDFPITLVQIDADTIQGQYTDGGTQVAFTIQMNANGTVTLTQNVPLEHLVDGAPGAPHNDALDLDGLINATITITDGDGDSATASAPIGDNLVFLDDGPDAQVDGQATLDQLVLDETRPLGTETDGDSNPAGLATVQANFANNFVGPVDYGADGAGTTTYSLFLSANGIGSGLYALDPTDTETTIDGFGQGAEITLSINGAGTLITGSAGGTEYFTISIDPATGVVTFTQLANVWHSDTANDDDTSSLMTAAAANIQVVQRVTDSDGDFDTAAINIGQGVFHIEDDGPEFTNVDAVLNIDNDADPSGTGNMDFDLGSDGPSANNNVISVTNFNVSVNGVPLDPSAFELVEGAETATTASYTFSFDYDTGSGGTATATGTLVFDKVNGSYTVDLDGPIQGFSILQTATGTLFQGYEFGTSNLDGSQPEISVTQIQGTPGDPQPDDLFVQFTSVSEPSSGTGDNNLEVTNWVPGADNPPPVDSGGDTNWNAGQLFNQTDGWVSTSNTANGVDGDTIQGGEVLDFTLVQGANPTGVLADPATYGQASSMFLKFDGIGTGEDMIVVLKLYDTVTETYTTRAIMIQNSDIIKGPGTGPGDYSGISLDNNDGLVIIESNDYNLPGENYVIVGAQIAGSDEGVTGSAINLNGAIGAAGDSDANNDGVLDTQAFSTDVNDGPFKISSIGFVTTESTDQNATLDFDVTITEADGDSETTSVTVNIGDPPALLAAAESDFQTQSVSKTAANDDYSSLLASDSVQKSYANASGFGNVGTTGITSAMVAASGLGMVSSSLQGFDNPSSSNLVQSDFQSLSIQAAGQEGLDAGLASISLGSELSGPAVNAVNLSSSSLGFDDHGFGGSLDAIASGGAELGYVPAYASGEPTFASVPALAANVPTVSMASADMLRAANVEGSAQNGGSVEQVLADALGDNASTIDGVLANLPGGLAELSAIANLASPDGTGVPAWDMGMQGGFAPMHDVLFKVEAAMIHQDAVQPA